MPDFDLGTARGKIEIDSSGAVTGIGSAKTAIGGLDKDMDKTAATMGRAGLALGGVGALAVAGFGLAVGAASNFETRMSAIAAVSGATEGELEAIRAKALQLGADTKFSASEAGSAIEELVKAGIPLEGVINGAADATVALAAAGEIDLPEAATIAANAMNQFGLAAADMPKVADLIAGAANASAIDVGEFGFALSQAGATANLVGLSFDDLSVAIAAMGNAGIKGSDAGTSLKTFLSNLQPTTEKQTTLMQELGLITAEGGNNFFDAAGNIKSMSDVAQTLQESLKGMTAQEKTMALEVMFGSDAIRAAAIIADNGAAGFDKLAGNMGKVTAADVAAKRMDNLGGSIEQFTGSVETAMIQAGAPFQEIIRGIVDALTKLVNVFGGLSPNMQKFIILGGLATAMLIGLAGVALLGVSGFLKAKKSITEFREAIQSLNLASKRAVIAEKARQVVTKIGTAIQWAFNTAMMANPIFLVIAALVALGVAIFVLYQKFEPFREFIDSLWQFLQETFKKVIKFFRELPGKIGDYVIQLIDTVINLIKELPAKIAYAIGFIVGVYISMWILVINTVIEWVPKIIGTIIGFLTELPGKVWHWLVEVVKMFTNFIGEAIVKVGEVGPRIIGAIVNFFTELPGKIWFWLVEAVKMISNFIGEAVPKAVQFGIDFFNGVINKIKEMPGEIKNLLGDIITAIKTKIGEAFTAVKGFAGSMWDGFKAGLGFGSPSFIHKAIWDIVDTVQQGTKDMGKEVSALQGLGSKLPDVGATMAVGIGAGVLGPAAAATAGVAPSGKTVAIEHLEINNPVGETTDESITRTMQKLEFAGYLGG